ncbi:uncharacterized protein E0L32_010210 [Thyridium curvatum]|uniref:ELYS-like domain-containing protein n=1 Tax=Thyridium curvatum TaxID=1093900 RepID=A0A507AKW5_9PEZI|nr:uncharacterized protein E0L32_010210 [Thyridium curvatum]TPX08143.1 hypothetical protein E0L32_010210 [Thyridium curvatum]
MYIQQSRSLRLGVSTQTQLQHRRFAANEVNMATALDYAQFHQVFRPDVGSPYDQHLIREVEANRKSMNGLLFIDRVLKAMGITKAKVYPPRGENGLHALHQQICAAKMSTHHKLSVLYYLLLDHDDAHPERAQGAYTFAFQAGVPTKYQLFMQGLWYMDRRQFPLALEHLAHPSLLPEFSDDIITTLVHQAENNDYSLALAYYYAVQPVIKASETLELLFGAIARTNVIEAFNFTRAQSEPARQQLFEQLIASVLGGAASQDITTRSSELVGLHFDSSEESWFHDYLTTGEGRKLKKAKDTVMMRLLVTGQYRSGLGEKQMAGQWGVVLQGFKQGMGGRAAYQA